MLKAVVLVPLEAEVGESHYEVAGMKEKSESRLGKAEGGNISCS